MLDLPIGDAAPGVQRALPALARAPLTQLPSLRCRQGGALVSAARTVPEETAVAFVYDGSSRAVMMATPHDLEDFAVGFSLAEGVIGHVREIAAIEVEHGGDAVQLRMTLHSRGGASNRHQAHAGPGACRSATPARLTGPSGCGLCGVTRVEEALRPVRLVPRSSAALSARDIAAAMAALADGQQLNREAHALHAAALWRHGDGIVALREDIGRHSALDKLAGALARANEPTAGAAVLLTSRVSVELVQKTARLGAALIAAVSAPTALAVRTANDCGITLVAVVRGGDFEVFTHPARIAAPGM